MKPEPPGKGRDPPSSPWPGATSWDHGCHGLEKVMVVVSTGIPGMLRSLKTKSESICLEIMQFNSKIGKQFFCLEIQCARIPFEVSHRTSREGNLSMHRNSLCSQNIQKQTTWVWLKVHWSLPSQRNHEPSAGANSSQYVTNNYRLSLQSSQFNHWFYVL